MTGVARSTLFGAGLGLFAAAVGLAAVSHSRIAVLLTVMVALLALVAVRPFLVWWDLLLVGLGGSLILSYGFANVGLPQPVPLPLADVIGVVLFVRAWTARSFRWPATAPFAFAAVFVAVATARLVVDYPIWHRAAVRDYTLALEIVFLPIGYWAMRTYGIEHWRRALNWIFVACLVYFAFFNLSDRIAALGPTVGLQRPVPLLGSYGGAGTAAAAGLFYFALVRPFGRVSYVLAAGFLAELAIFQSRGLYLALPAAVIVTYLLAGPSSARARTGLAATFGVGAIALALLLPLAPKGRLGPVSPWFTLQQLQTLQGHAGPGAGTYEDRIAWFHEVLHEVKARGTVGWVAGVGLGPDLIGAVKGTSAQLRKPHDDYLEVFARLGLPALFIFVGMLFSAAATIVGAGRRASGLEGRFLWFIVATVVVFYLVAALQPLLAFPYGTIPLFSLLGAGLALAERTTRQDAE
jgi:hypothetical protein